MVQDQKIIKNKLGLLKLAQTLGSVSEACKVMGFSRDSCNDPAIPAQVMLLI